MLTALLLTRSNVPQQPDINQIHERCVVDREDFEAWMAERGMAWQALARGEYGVTLEEAQLRFVCEDPVRWAKAFLNDPDADDEPWTFFDYQEESVRAWAQDAIHQDGAEVGKTREIVVLILWGQCTGFGFTIKHPWILVGAPQQTHLDEIIMAIEAHVGADEDGRGQKSMLSSFWRKPKKHPHYMMRFHSPMGRGRVYFRPAGHDGEAFRGVHVNAMALFDEAAKVKRKVCWSEFHRSLKPGCVQRVYSVPDGDNTTDYYRMTQQAIPNLQPGHSGMRLFHWPKTLMPAPFWSAEREREFIRRYGGKDAPGYQRNVLGLHGQAENPVWPWELLDANIRELPAYRCLKLIVDSAQNTVRVTVYRVTLAQENGKKSPQEEWIADYDIDATPLNSKDRDAVRSEMRALLKRFIEPLGTGVYWFGADLGFSKDPTEIMVSQEIGSDLVDLVRIHTKGLGYDLQCELIYCLDELAGFQGGWGVDFGSAGTAVVQMLQSLEIYADGHYDERMVGFQFASALDAIDEEGNVLEQENAKTGNMEPVRLPAKELATNLMTARFQRQGWAMPYDSEVVGHLSNHTAREGAKHRIFSKENDHTIDAKRCQILRKVFDEQVGGVDVFSSGVHNRSAA